MGLDMYLFKTKKVNGLKEKDYEKICRVVEENVEKVEDIVNIRLAEKTGIPQANEFKDIIKERGEYIKWFSIFEQVGYWRKANHIHYWFVDNVQNGIDECQLSVVSKEQVENLLQTVKIVQDSKEKAPVLLPTGGGFFFGSTEYGEWYEADNQQTINILEKVLNETDFENEILFYQSSW